MGAAEGIAVSEVFGSHNSSWAPEETMRLWGYGCSVFSFVKSWRGIVPNPSCSAMLWHPHLSEVFMGQMRSATVFSDVKRHLMGGFVFLFFRDVAFFRGLGKEKPMSLHSSRGYVFWHMILEAGGEPWQICSCCMCRMVFSLSQRAQGTWQRCFGLSCESPEGRCGFPVMQLMEKQKCCCWGLAGVGAALPSCCDSA